MVNIEVAFTQQEDKWTLNPFFKSGEISMIKVADYSQPAFKVGLTEEELTKANEDYLVGRTRNERANLSAVWHFINRFNENRPIHEQGAIITLHPAKDTTKSMATLNDFAIWVRDNMLAHDSALRLNKHIVGICLESLFLKFRSNKDSNLINIAADTSWGADQIKFTFHELRRVLEDLTKLQVSVVLLASRTEYEILHLLALRDEEGAEDLCHNIYEVDGSSAINDKFVMERTYTDPRSTRTQYTITQVITGDEK